MRGQLLDIRGLSRPVLDAWRQLASAAVEPNPFFGPEMAMAAARHLPGGEGDRLLAVFDGEAMVLALPVRRVRAYRQVPLPTVLAWGTRPRLPRHSARRRGRPGRRARVRAGHRGRRRRALDGAGALPW